MFKIIQPTPKIINVVNKEAVSIGLDEIKFFISIQMKSLKLVFVLLSILGFLLIYPGD
jgi:hypothetical protein